jgi:alginate O-acetyltransferase complex protein AlgJ
MMIRNSHIGRLLRVGTMMGLLALPASVFWNLAGLEPRLSPSVLRLAGVTDPPPQPHWTLASFADRTLQAAIVGAVETASPIRPLLIRINNEIRYTTFGYISTPDVFQGDNGQLMLRGYWSEYCSRGPDSADRKARELIPKLADIQAYFEARDRIFLYLISPSKAAHLPEHFVDRFPCASSEQDRNMLLPRLDRLLREAGINVIDAASLVHGLKGIYPVDLFPQSGIHWNALAIARAVDATIAEVNRLARRPLLPRLDWTYTVPDRPRSNDIDLASLLNLLVIRKWYGSVEVEFRHAVPCDMQPENPLKVAIVGSSFTNELPLVLNSGGCLLHARQYYYLSGVIGGNPVTMRAGLNDDDLAAIRDADVMIVEENESFAGESQYIVRLRAVLSGQDP